MSSVWVLLYVYTGIIILCVVLVNECRCCVLINTPPSPTYWQQEDRMGYWVSGTWDRNCILLLYWRHMLQKVSDIFVLNTSVGYLGHLWLTLFLVQVKNTWNKHEKWGKGKWEKGGREKLLKNTLGKQHWLKPSSLCSAWNMYTSLDHCWGLLCMYLQTAHWLLVLLVLFIFKSFKLHLNPTGIPFFLSLSLFFSFSLLSSLHLSI